MTIQLIKKLKEWFKSPSQTVRPSWEEEYLSQSTSLEDLERRQRRLERGEVVNPHLSRLRGAL